jgi:hypothetical protein
MEQMMAHLLAKMKTEIRTNQAKADARKGNKRRNDGKAGSRDAEQLRRNAGQDGNQPRKDDSQDRHP